jgi:hypothetical protein
MIHFQWSAVASGALIGLFVGRTGVGGALRIKTARHGLNRKRPVASGGARSSRSPQTVH